jgi:hypothetical protein
MKVEDSNSGAEHEVVVFSILKPSVCSDCGTELAKGSLLRLQKDRPLCLHCADLDHLVFLPAGDVALTRRSRKYSTLFAVVVRFSRSRGRYEHQGLLVEQAALERAEAECLSNEEARRLARDRRALYRERADARYIEEFSERIRRYCPACPQQEAEAVARYACEKYSGRIGRSAAAKEFDESAMELALRAHVRHTHTEYDRLLARGWERDEARAAVAAAVAGVMDRWCGRQQITA